MLSSAKPKARSSSSTSKARAGACARAVGAAPRAGLDALRLSRQARDQRPRAPEASADRGDPRRAAARPRLQRRAMHDAPRASRRALVPGASPRGRGRRGRRSISAEAASAPRTSASAAARSSARIPLGRLSFQGAQHLQTLDALTDYDRGREDAERTWLWEQWPGTYEWREASVTRRVGDAAPLDARPARDACATRSAYASAASPASPATPTASSRCRCGSGPRRRGLSRCGPCRRPFAEDPPVPALMLDETPEDKASLILPPRTLQSEPRAALARSGARAAVPPDAAHSPRRRFRAGRVRRDGLKSASARQRPARCRGNDSCQSGRAALIRPRIGAAKIAHDQSPRGRDEPVSAQQHADNPVDWHPWGEEALALARREGKPILLSVGYSACHWCHVMAHESFEDPEVAAAMNARFRQHQGRSRGASGPRPDLPDRACAADPPLGRLAAHDVPHARRRAVLRRHVFSARGPLRLAGIPRAAAAGRRRLSRAGRRDRRAGRAAQGRARESGTPTGRTPAAAGVRRRQQRWPD